MKKPCDRITNPNTFSYAVLHELISLAFRRSLCHSAALSHRYRVLDSCLCRSYHLINSN